LETITLPVSNTAAQPLRKEELPILRTEGSHKDTQDLEERANCEGHSEESCIRRTTRVGTDEEQEKDLRGPDPGNVRWWVIESGRIV
jgi:hypothetical protein